MATPATTDEGIVLKTIFVGANAAVTLKGLEVVEVTVLLLLSDALRVYALAALVRIKVGKLAMPLTAGWVSVPLSEPPPGLADRAMLILSLLVMRLPEASSIATCTPDGESISEPAAVLVGGVTKTSELESNRRDSRNSPVA